MIPQVGVRHTSTVAGTQRARYHCVPCGADSDAIVSAVTQSSVAAPYFIGQAAAAGAAASSAIAELPDEMRRVLGLAGCPRCAARDQPAVQSAWVSAVLGGLLSVAILVIVGGVTAATLLGLAAEQPSAGTILGALGAAAATLAVIALAARAKFRRLVRDAESLVVWDAPPPA